MLVKPSKKTAANQEWVVQTLPVRLCMVSGCDPPRPGMEALEVQPAIADDSRLDVWLWVHWVSDPAGSSAQHFTYISQARLPNQHNWGISPSLMGKSIINGHLSIAVLVYQRVSHLYPVFVPPLSLCYLYPRSPRTWASSKGRHWWKWRHGWNRSHRSTRSMKLIFRAGMDYFWWIPRSTNTSQHTRHN